MKLLLVLCVLAMPVQAVVVAHAITSDGRTLSLHDTKCKSETGWYVELSSTTTILFQGCWNHHPTIDGVVHIKWDDGDESIAPKRVFKQGPKGSV
jgi:hypothetical protein